MQVYVQKLYENKIDEYLNSIDNILDSAFIEYDKTMLIALRLKPIYLKTEKDELIKSVQDYFFENFNIKEVIITLDSDLFYKVKNSITIEEKINAIDIARSRT